jgi:hypothetical protein
MRRLWLLAFLLLPGETMAQNWIAPPPFSGQGTVSVTTASKAISAANVTATTNSSAFPASRLPNAVLRVKNGGAVTAYICWLGGTCTSAVGEPIAAGEAITKRLGALNLSTTPPTAIAASSTVTLEIEW